LPIWRSAKLEIPHSWEELGLRYAGKIPGNPDGIYVNLMRTSSFMCTKELESWNRAVRTTVILNVPNCPAEELKTKYSKTRIKKKLSITTMRTMMLQSNKHRKIW